jgi:hypothetical protein
MKETQKCLHTAMNLFNSSRLCSDLTFSIKECLIQLLFYEDVCYIHTMMTVKLRALKASLLKYNRLGNNKNKTRTCNLNVFQLNRSRPQTFQNDFVTPSWCQIKSVEREMDCYVVLYTTTRPHRSQNK